MTINAYHLEIRQLRYFIAVAEELHFNRAAKRLNISQPPLSHTIQQMEEQLGAMLFVRTKRSVELTDAGRVLLKGAYEIVDNLKKVTRDVTDTAQGITGELRIGVNYTSPLNPIFSKIIGNHRKLYPNVRLDLHETTSVKQIANLRDNTLDVCFIWPTKNSYLKKDVVIMDVASDQLKLALPKDSPLVTKESVSFHDLKDERLMVTPRQLKTDFYEYLNQGCLKAGFEPNIYSEIAQLPIVLSMVAANLGVSFLPAWLQEFNKDLVVFRDIENIPEGKLEFPLALAYLVKNNSNIVNDFVEVARQTVSENS